MPSILPADPHHYPIQFPSRLGIFGSLRISIAGGAPLFDFRILPRARSSVITSEIVDF